jgi:fengycin family lipopeptide synthetase D
MDSFYKENVEDILGVTPMQAGMLFHYLSEPGSGVYFDQHCYHLKGIIKIDCLKRAWNYIARNNEMLRTVFRWNGLKLPIQIILKEYEIPFSEYDYSKLNMAEKQTCMEEILRCDQRESINIEMKPYRVFFCKLSEEEYNMIVSAHHVIYDGWSNALMFKELLYAYGEYLNNREPKRSKKTKYKELVKWYQNQDKQKQKVYWENYLKGYKSKNFLSIGKSYDSMGKTCKYLYQLDEVIEKDVYQFIRQEQTTLAALIYTTWGILLQKYSGHEDTLFGVTLSGRTTDIPLVENIVGLFVNTLPLRLKIKNESNIGDILREVNNTIISFEEYQGTPLVELKQYSSIGIEEQLFDTIVVVQNYPLDVKVVNDGQEMSIEFVSSFYSTNFGISLDIRTLKGIEFVFNFNDEKFDPLSVEKMCECVIKIIKVLILDQGQDRKVEDIEVFNFNERNIALMDIKNTIDYLSGLEEVDFDEIF